MEKPATTDCEKRLDKMMSRYGSYETAHALQKQLQELVIQMNLSGAAPELIAYSVAQHASACVAALKMAKIIDPHLADALAEDFFETIHRAFPGAPGLRSKQ
ncbi:MAG TPA: hypothetical protein VLH80_07565 [Nitrospiraceae bacterium]|nr:hypothetical protein [Nitrospiraceae bacterium]